MSKELDRRELRNLEDCRLAWEEAGSPLALSVALTKAELPEWLRDALIVLLADAADNDGSLLRDLWKAVKREQIDVVRVSLIATLRSSGFTWEQTFKIAREFLATQPPVDLPEVDEDALVKAYYRLCAGLEHRGRYYWADQVYKRWTQPARRRIAQFLKTHIGELPPSWCSICRGERES